MAKNTDANNSSTISRTGVSPFFLPRITDKKASSARSPGSYLAHERTICCDSPESAKVLRHHHNNQLRMLTHRWKRLGLKHPASSNRNDHTLGQSHGKSQHAITADSVLKITPIQARHATALRDINQENEKTKGLCCLGSNSSDVEIPDVKVSDEHSPTNTSVSSECHSDSDLSDQEQESIETSKWAAVAELRLKPKPFDEDPDLPCSTDRAVYPEVLPAPLKVLNFTQNLSSPQSSEDQQSLYGTDPCLAPITARLMELERLQAVTVQKERAKLLTTANTRNANRTRKSDLGCKTGILRDAECSLVMCSFTKLMVCPNSLCRRRHHTCPSTKSGQGSRGMLPHPALPKCPDTMAGKCNKAETLASNFSVSLKISRKLTVPSRTNSPKTQRGLTSAKKTTAPNRKI